MTRDVWRSVLLAFLLVGSVVGGTGAVSGQTAGEYTHTWNGSPGQVLLDVGSYSGQLNIQFNSPSQEQPIWAGTLSGSQTDSGRVRLVNQGAYETVTVTITGPSSEPSYESGQVAVAFPNSYSVGTTGGDTDMQCGTLEQSRTAVGAQVIDCTGYPGIDDINTSSTDAAQLRTDIRQDALDTEATAESEREILSNYLSDTETTARIRGQNAYIRALNNGSSQATARIEAEDAIEDYYATKQRNLLDIWNSGVASLQYQQSLVANESGISESYLRVNNTVTGEVNNHIESEFTTTQFELVNGDSYTVQRYGVFWNGNQRWLSPGSPGTADGAEFTEILIGDNLAETDTLRYMNVYTYGDINTEIQNQNQQVEADLDTIVNNTYQQYQAGEINNSDLVDPYTLSQRSANESYESWAAAYLTSIGANSPENFENTGSFQIELENGATYEGILFVTEDVSIQTGQTYDSANLAGTEYVVTADDTHELTGTWTVTNITTQSGNSVDSTTYEDTTYQSTNVSQLIQEYENLAEERAEIEAREEALIANSGVDSYSGDEPIISPQMALAIGGALVVVVVFKNVT